jgi:hypothetical protein
MTVRISEGQFLEILESTPSAGVPIEFEVYDGATLTTQLALLENASEGAFQPQFCEVGSGSFRLQRSDPKAAYLVKGNYVKCRLGTVPRFAFFIEEPEDVLASVQDAGGELITVAGAERSPTSSEPRCTRRSGRPRPRRSGPRARTTTAPGRRRSRVSGRQGRRRATSSSRRSRGSAATRRHRPRRRLEAARTRRRTEPRSGSRCTSGGRCLASPPAGRGASRRRRGRPRRSSGSSTRRATIRSTRSPTRRDRHRDQEPVGRHRPRQRDPPHDRRDDREHLGHAARGQTEAADRGATGRTLEVAYQASPALGESGDLTSVAAATGNWLGLALFIPSNASSERVFSGATFGAILATLIDEAQARGTLPRLSYDFTTDLDSQGQPWADTHELSFHIGTTLLDVWRQLVALGLEGLMTTELRLRAFVEYARHFEDTVILRKGHHFAGDVAKKGHDSGLRTRFLVEGAGGRVIEAADTTLEVDTRIGRREGYFEMRTSDDATELQRAADGSLELARLDSEAIELPVLHGTAVEGHYEPFVDYREGDWISVEPAGDGTIDAHRVVGYRLAQAGLDYEVGLNLNSVALDREIRLRRAIDALTGSGRGTTAGGAFGLGGTGGIASTAASSQVAATAGDTPGYLLPKLLAGTGIGIVLAGATGRRRVQITRNPIALDELSDVSAAGADAPGADQSLVWDAARSLWVPKTIASGVTDHGALTGLADDDHPQYTTAAELAAYAQPVDAELTALAGLASAADKLPYFTGSGSAALTTLSAFIRTLLDDADAATARATLGVTAGSALTVEEVDGAPTDAAVTKIVFPNGTLAIAGHVATYTPTGGGSGNLTAPSAVSVDLGASTLLTRRAVVNTEDDLFDASPLNAKWLAYTGNNPTTDLTTLPGWCIFTSAGSKLQAVPAGDWSIETEVIAGDLEANGFQNAGLILTSGTTVGTSSDARLGIGENNSLQSYRIVFEKFVNGVFSTVFSQWGIVDIVDHMFLKITKSGTTYTVYWSRTGKTWHRFFQQAGLGFTPTHFGLNGETGSAFNGFYRY